MLLFEILVSGIKSSLLGQGLGHEEKSVICAACPYGALNCAWIVLNGLLQLLLLHAHLLYTPSSRMVHKHRVCVHFRPTPVCHWEATPSTLHAGSSGLAINNFNTHTDSLLSPRSLALATLP
jgi:hypothetical protein